MTSNKLRDWLRRAIFRRVRAVKDWAWSDSTVVFFAVPPAPGVTRLPPSDDLRILVCHGHFPADSVVPVEIVQRIYRSWRSPARRLDTCFLIIWQSTIVGYGWARTGRSVNVEEIGAELAVPGNYTVLFDFFITRNMRGKGIYKSCLLELRRYLAPAGAVIYAYRDNVASVRGIQSAGFQVVAEIRSRRLLGAQYARRIDIGNELCGLARL